MEVVVRQQFIDKYTGRQYRPGDTITVTDERYDQIVRKLGPGAVEKVEAATASATPARKPRSRKT